MAADRVVSNIRGPLGSGSRPLVFDGGSGGGCVKSKSNGYAWSFCATAAKWGSGGSWSSNGSERQKIDHKVFRSTRVGSH